MRNNIAIDKLYSSCSEAFDEELLFEKPDMADTVKVSMRGAPNNYFGITQVTPISSTQPIGMVVSGMTSPIGEMCLQVATKFWINLHFDELIVQVSNGDMNKDFTSVMLDTCAYAIASGDGRELWRKNSKGQFESVVSKPPKW